MADFVYKSRKSECPYELALATIAKKWKPRILMELARGSCRFGDIRYALGSVSDKMLSSALAEMTADGLVSRTSFSEVPPRVEYAMTPQGEALWAAIQPLKAWSEKVSEN
ncbi:helix-turn-helix domain-containing protein [Marivivens sp. LCG002]|jgi:DNA-binding HxlR family transcriptional regulator|uniref:winged helix-turn-helix transcriptional regulator n=1 Tax=Marivivens sp. LCG002 TaxID=3051171 RepID=UPI002555B6DB|nr:helix-turn-helix domain-containing protein [Marivivens sp. LCG002]WIV50142.1 helix-turn-helix domain-containing protein [Marivivens sp. LCG002]